MRHSERMQAQAEGPSARSETVADLAIEVTVVGGSTPCEAVYRIFDLTRVRMVAVRCTDGSVALLDEVTMRTLMDSASGGGRVARMAVERIARRAAPTIGASVPIDEAVPVLATQCLGSSHEDAIVLGEDGSVRTVPIAILMSWSNDARSPAY